VGPHLPVFWYQTRSKVVADCFRAAVDADGIRVLSVNPGRTASPQEAAIHEAEGKMYSPETSMPTADVVRIVVDVLGMNRTAEVTDISIPSMQKT
jgi:NADP-dependent 3-hydroxy acid dehydrogenase YdfG